MSLDRIKKLQDMLAKVGATERGSLAQTTLESRAAAASSGLTLDSRRTNTEALEAKLALDSLEAVRSGQSIDGEQRFVLEAIVMPLYRPVIDVVNDDIVIDQLTTTWKELGEEARRPWRKERILAVGRIDVPGIPYAGTGFIVGPNLIMTNRHVAGFFAQGLGKQVGFQPGQSAGIDFYHEKGVAKTESLTVQDVVMIHPWWDMALLKVSGLPGNRKPLELSTADPDTLRGRRVVVIGYPGYDPFGDQEYQQVQSRIFRDAYYVKRFQPGLFRAREEIESYKKNVSAVTHDCSTLGGNSGSAVIDVDSGRVVALHFAGSYLVANYAVSTFDLAQDKRVVDAGLNFVGRLEPRGDFYGPMWSDAQSGTSSSAAEAGASVQSVRSSDTAEVVIPLKVTFSLGAPLLVAPVPAPPAAVAAVPPTEGMFGRPVPVVDYGRFSLSSLKADRFDWQTALSLALASRLAYEENGAIFSNAVSKWGFRVCSPIEADDTKCFFAEADEVVLISFRGTINLANWLANLDVISTTRSYGSVHRGFLGALEVVDAQLRSKLSDLQGRKLLLTGHSLGGALATIAAAEWQGKLPISWVYTYGQPAVGRKTFPAFMAQHYAGKIIRFVNNNDVVPRVPPFYTHVGSLYHFNANGNLEPINEAAAPAVSPESRMLTAAEFDRMRAQLLGQSASASTAGTEALAAPTLEGFFPSVRDHNVDRYLAKIAAKT